MLSIFRFHGHNAIRFNMSLDWRIDWSHEFTQNLDFQQKLEHARAHSLGWIDYATTFYWYQKEVGFPHGDLPSLDERIRPVLHTNLQ